jgi:uncharacterized protein
LPANTLYHRDMPHDEVILKTHVMLKEKFGAEATGHDYWHMYRTWKVAKRIASKEKGADMFTVELAALLHDIADWKFHDGDEEAGPHAAREWLESLNVNESVITHIEDIIRNVSFKGAHVKNKLGTIEGQIVHDADKLDAIGAMGIGRAFAYGGANGRPMHDPKHTDELHISFEAYKNNNSPTISHFYEKLLLLKDRMFTKTGKELAQHRHKVMEQFLDEFYAEWEGKR